MKICPICTLELSNFAQAIGRTVKIGTVIYHLACVGKKSVKELEGKDDKSEARHT